jgi:hypothetical protein
VRSLLVSLATAVLAVAAVGTALDDGSARDSLPPWVPGELGGFELRAASGAPAPLDREVAIGVVRDSVFLGEAPSSEPTTVPLLVSGRIARGPVQPSPTGEVLVPREENVPAWLVVWRGLDGATLDERLGTWSAGSLVDAVFLVDGVAGDCCWVTRFLAGDSRLG